MNKQELTALLRDYCMTPSLSGYESKMAYRIQEDFKAYTDDVRIDKIGNVIATFPGTDPEAPKVMVYAHTDSLGFIVRRIDDDGFIRVDRLGGIPEKVLPALKVLIGTEDGKSYITGMFGNKSHHLTSADEKFKVATIPELYIDIGAKSAEEVRALGIEVGCPVVYKPDFEELQGDRVIGTAIDDRAGCANLVQVASLLKGREHASTVFLVATVWEEFNIRGAVIACRTTHPDIAIAIDGGGLDGCTPDLKGWNNIKMGDGPGMTKYTFHSRGTLNGTIANTKLVNHTLKAAKKLGLNIQRASGFGGVNDGAWVQLEDKGVAIIEIGSPFRYTHTPVEMTDMGDMVQVGELITEMLCTFDRDFDPSRF